MNGPLVRRAASEVYGRPVLAPWIRWLAICGAVAGVALLASCCGVPGPGSSRESRRGDGG